VLSIFQSASGLMPVFRDIGFMRREDTFELPDKTDLSYARMALKRIDQAVGEYDEKR